MKFHWWKELFAKRYVRAVIFLKNGFIDSSTQTYGKKPEGSKKFTRGNGAYLIDQSGIYHRKRKPYSFYFEDNPFPIIFDQNKHSIATSVKSSQELKTVLETKVVADMLRGMAERTILMLLLFAILAAIGVLLANELGVVQLSGTLSTTP